MSWAYTVVAKKAERAIAGARGPVFDAAHRFADAFAATDEAQASAGIEGWGMTSAEIAAIRLTVLETLLRVWAPRAHEHAESFSSAGERAQYLRDLATTIRKNGEWYRASHLNGTLLLTQPIESLMDPWHRQTELLEAEARSVLAAGAVEEATELVQKARAALGVDLQAAADLQNLARKRLNDAERGGSDPVAVRAGRVQLFQFALAEFAPAAAKWALTLDEQEQHAICADLAHGMRVGRDWLEQETKLGNVVSPLFESAQAEWAEMIDELTIGAQQ